MKTPVTKALVPLFLFAIGVSLRAQPMPHHFSRIQASADRTITLTLDGSVSNMFPNLSVTVSNQFMQMFDLYAVEASSNLANWTSLAWLLRTNNNPNPLQFADTNAASLDQGFYRTFTNHLPTPYLKPSGPFYVGRVDRVMIDPARTNLYRYTPATNAFMVTFWYPADAPPAGLLPAAGLDRCLAMDTNLYKFGGYDPCWAPVIAALVGRSFPGVPLAAGTNRFPVVLDSHGLPAWRKLGSSNAEDLASHGYVVLAIDHPDCWATEFPDGRYLAGNHSGDTPNRLRDMTFLLDKLAELDATDPLLAGRLDLERIGVSGGSFGGMVVTTCKTDNRVKCVALYDATNFDPNTRLQKPLLIGLGEANYFYTADLQLFNQALTNAVLFQLHGAGHMTPCDIGWTMESPGGRAPTLAMNACRVWFFDTYLKGETSTFPTNPEIYNLHIK